jgi:hypothetical protein
MLNIAPRDLSKTVRARRSERLPVILSFEEIQNLPARLSG